MSDEVMSPPRRLTPDEQAEVLEARAQVQRLAAQVMRAYPALWRASGMAHAELLAVGDAEAAHARTLYDAAKGTPYEVYLRLSVQGAMIDALKAETKHRRALREGAEKAAAGLDGEEDAETCLEVIAAGMALALAGADPEAAAMRREAQAEVRAAVAEESEEARELVQRHYFRGEVLEKAGRSLGLSRSTVKRRHGAALKRIGARLGGGG
jgi:RNA polymerase sigma factor (sigma-70 family)